ncbi:MAG: SGNH/GDSL hydrolase family protein [Clostridia bacterium]|nr:SGNH/GDSL hydrolase family protein [Clostridia bacterium]
MPLNYIWGDSIGQGIYYREDIGRYRICRRNCVQLLRENGLEIESHAIMGCTVEKGLEDFCASETVPGGACVIEYGGNDCDLDWQAVSDDPEKYHEAKVPLDVFREKLRRFVRGAAERQLRPVLVTPPPILSDRYFSWVTEGKSAEHILRYLGDREHISRWQERYASAVRDVSEQEGCRLLDIRSRLLDERDLPSLMSADGIHPNEKGYAVMADCFLKMLGREREKNAG